MNHKPTYSLFSTENADDLIGLIFYGSIIVTAICSCLVGVTAAVVTALLMGR